MNLSVRKILRGLFFLACLSFVLWQCYLSFERFLLNPRSISIGVDYAKNWPVPRVILCPSNIQPSARKNCAIQPDEYYNGSKWEWSCVDDYDYYKDDESGDESTSGNEGSGSGDGSTDDIDYEKYKADNDEDCVYNCSDTKNILGNPIDHFHEVHILSFQGKQFTFLNTSMNALWKPVDFVYDVDNTNDEYPLVALCYELVLPVNVQSQGIKLIQIFLKTTFIGFMNLRPPGFFYQNSDATRIKIPEILDFPRKYSVDLEYEIDRFLKIGEEPCNPDPLYDRDKCVIDQMLEYSMKLHGCIPPSFGNYGLKVCQNGSHETIAEVDKLIDCMMPCTLFTMRSRTVIEEAEPDAVFWFPTDMIDDDG